MKNRNITILSIIVSLAGMGTFFLQPAFAQTSNLVVEVWNDSLSQYELLGNQALFNEANFLPGEEVERLVRITNNSADSSSVSAEALDYPGFPNIGDVPADDLSRALTFIIKEKDGSDLYGGTTGEKTLFDFYSAGETQFSTVSAVSSKEFEFKISFPLDRGDEWQEKTTFFDIIIGLTGSGGGGGGGENGGGGGGGGGGVLPPGLTITNESSLVSEGCDTTISWTTTYFSTSRVIYSPEGEDHVLDLSDDSGTFPLYGYYSTTPEYDQDPNRVTYHTVTLLNLEPNTDYYFRCISHASPPTIGKECSFNTGECRGIIEVQGTSTEAGPSTITSGGTGPWQNQEPGTGEGEVL
ncbi:MAG: fibronectin type III domain-containing protein, partial [Candidatus Omnitrophota bacterium]